MSATTATDSLAHLTEETLASFGTMPFTGRRGAAVHFLVLDDMRLGTLDALGWPSGEEA